MSHRSSATVRKSKSFDKEINNYQKANRGKEAQPKMDSKAEKPRKKKTVVRKVDPNANAEDILKELSKEEIEAVDKACVKAYGQDWVLSPDRFYKDSGKPPTGKFDNAKLANFEMIQALKLIEKEQGLAPGTLTKNYESPMPKVPSDALEKVPTLYPKTDLDVAIVKESQKAKERQSTAEPKSLKAEPDITEGPFEGRPTDETSEVEATRNTEVSEAETCKEASSMKPVDQEPEPERENLEEPGKEIEPSEKMDLIAESSLRKGSAPVSAPERSRSTSRKGSQPVSAREKSARVAKTSESVAKTSTQASSSERSTALTGKRGETETAKTENETASAAKLVDQKLESERDKLEEPRKEIEPSEKNDLIKESSLRKGSAPVLAPERRRSSSRKGSQPVSAQEKGASVAKTSTRTSAAKTSTQASGSERSTASTGKLGDSASAAKQVDQKKESERDKLEEQGKEIEPSEKNDVIAESSPRKGSAPVSAPERSRSSSRKGSQPVSAREKSASAAKRSENVAKTSTQASVAKSSTRTSAAKSSTQASDAKSSESVAKTSETVAKTSESVAKTSESVAKTSESVAKTSESVAKTSESVAKTSTTRTSGSERAATSRRKRSGSASAAKQPASDRRRERSKNR